MRILATILTLLVTIVGFFISYGYTYKKVSGYLYSSPDIQSSVPVISQKKGE